MSLSDRSPSQSTGQASTASIRFLRGLALLLAFGLIAMTYYSTRANGQDNGDNVLSTADQQAIRMSFRLAGVSDLANIEHPLPAITKYGISNNASHILFAHILRIREWRYKPPVTDEQDSVYCAKILESLTSGTNVHHVEPRITRFDVLDQSRSSIFEHLQFPPSYTEATLDRNLSDWIVSQENKLTETISDVTTLERRYGRSLRHPSERPVELHGMEIYFPGDSGSDSLYRLSERNDLAFIKVDGLPSATVESLEYGDISHEAALYLSGSKYAIVQCKFAEQHKSNSTVTKSIYPNQCRTIHVLYSPVDAYSYIDASAEIAGLHLIVGINDRLTDQASAIQKTQKLYGLLVLRTTDKSPPRLQFLELSARERLVSCEFITNEPSILPPFREIVR